MAFWSRGKREKAAREQAKADLTMREVMARERTVGPHARPWKERRTTKPFPEYRAKRWEQWAFFDLDEEGGVIAPEAVVGAVFPDDFIIVNG